MKKTIKNIISLIPPRLKSWRNMKKYASNYHFNGLREKIFYSGKVIFFLALTMIFSNSCADKFDIGVFNTVGRDTNIGGDTVYVQLNPPWEGFNNPQDIFMGKEPFLYLADTDNDRIVMMNIDGQVLGIRSISRPVAIAQDFELNLIVCGKFDTTISGQTISLGAVYKLDLVSVSHRIEDAPIKRLLPRSTDFNMPQREYTGVTTFYDNSFYVARKGPNNSNLVDPDNSILIFRKKTLSNGSETDTLIGRVALLDPTTTGLLSANQITSLHSFNDNSYDVLLTLGNNNNFKVQLLQFVSSPEFTGYLNKLSPLNTEIMKPNRFVDPQGSTIDNSGNIFIADAGKDSVYKFNPFGDELISFGGTDLFNQPHSLAFFDRTLYVLDTGNNRVLRFILSTDI